MVPYASIILNANYDLDIMMDDINTDFKITWLGNMKSESEDHFVTLWFMITPAS